MNIRLDFWRDPSNWPRDTGSHVFLARAVHSIGKKLFGREWTGEETYTDPMQKLPVQKVQGSGGHPYFAHDLLMRHHPEFQRQPLKWPVSLPGSSFGMAPPSVKFTDEEWAAALAIVAENRARTGPAFRRFFQVQDEIVRLAESEKLLTAVRARAGGDPSPIPRSWWNSERISSRFHLCQINPSKPFDGGSAGDAYGWIFVTRGSLEEVLADVQATDGIEAPTNDAPRPKTENINGVGKVRKSIQAAYKKLFPSGEIPIGMSSQDRNDRIFGELEEMGLRTRPDKRTIERAISAMFD